MARIFVVGPAFTPQDEAALGAVSEALRASGHEAVTSRAGLRDFLKVLESADGVIALLDGATSDAATALALGVAHAHRRPALGLRSDARASPSEPLARIAWDACERVETVPEWTSVALRPRLEPFLAHVRVFAGTLVRDAVPKILEQEGRPLKFRPVADKEYPAVLKRKLVETTERLEASEFGVEQEEIADVLELLEALINLRKYDKESLRAIKEGKWRKRGGFEHGFLLDEEPPISSR